MPICVNEAKQENMFAYYAAKRLLNGKVISRIGYVKKKLYAYIFTILMKVQQCDLYPLGVFAMFAPASVSLEGIVDSS